jgi:hypothetical protein
MHASLAQKGDQTDRNQKQYHFAPDNRLSKKTDENTD